MSLRKEALNLHKQLKLAGTPSNALLYARQDFLDYLLAVLRQEEPVLPRASIEEWQKFLSLLLPHGIFPFLYWRIKHLPERSHPPKEIVSQLQSVFLSGVTTSLQIEKQLKKIQMSFQGKGVNFLLLKGPALARQIYPHPGLRPSGDLDLLVRPEQVIEARTILASLGYRCQARSFEIFKDIRQEEIFSPIDPSGRTVEIHWALHAFYDIEKEIGVDDFFARASAVDISGSKVQVLHPSDLLMHLAVHLVYNHGQAISLKWTNDVALLTNHLKNIEDWKELQARSQSYKARLAIELAVKLAQFWFGARLPDKVSDFAAWPPPEKSEKFAYNCIVLRSSNLFNLLRIRTSSSLPFTKRALLLFRFIFPPWQFMREEFQVKSYWQLPAAYVQRWAAAYFRRKND